MPKQIQKKVILCISNDIHTDQRLHKVCTSLTALNYEVELLGRKLPSSKTLDRSYTCKRLSILFNKGVLFYAFLNIQFFIYLLFKSTDIIVANDLDTLPACHFVSRLRRKKLVVDLHELFTEVPEVVNRKRVQQFWGKIESYFLPKNNRLITVCKSIADYYENKYQTPVSVVRNIPKRKAQYQTANKSDEPFVLLYQGAVNIGRGIETMIDMMPHLPSHFVLWIIGSGDINSAIQQRISDLNLEKRIKFFGRKEPSELKRITPQAHLGLSLEENMGLNYYFALPNKLFDYLHADVPMLVSPFPEMSAIVNTYQVGYIRQSTTPKGLALEIESIANNKTEYQNRVDACKQTKYQLTWENEFEHYQRVLES